MQARKMCIFYRILSDWGISSCNKSEFLSSSHTVFSCFHEHSEQLPKPLHETLTEPGLAGGAVFLNAHLDAEALTS